jgi:hypothetical protein
MIGDKPVPADYDGDGRAELALFRGWAGEWWIAKSSTNFTTAVLYRWGMNGDIPVPAESDVDGRAELTVFRPYTGQWFVLKSSTNYTASELYTWGQ